VCPPALSQHPRWPRSTRPSIAELDGHVARYAFNRALLLDGLPKLGIDKLAPADGAFTSTPTSAPDERTRWRTAGSCWPRPGVAVAPGIDFDTADGTSFIRLSFAGSTEDVIEALTRLGSHLGRLVVDRADASSAAVMSASLIPECVTNRTAPPIVSHPHLRLVEPRAASKTAGRRGEQHDVGVRVFTRQPRSARPRRVGRRGVVLGEPLDAVQRDHPGCRQHPALAGRRRRASSAAGAPSY